MPVHYEKVFTAADGDGLLRRLPAHLAQDGVTALVFNFIDQLTHGRTENSTLYEVARDTLGAPEPHPHLVRALAALGRAPRGGAARRCRCCSRPTTARSTATRRPRSSPSGTRPRTCATSSATTSGPRTPTPRWWWTTCRPTGSPRATPGTRLLLATGDRFFVYPTKLREYQARYRGAFLHGGVSPEEVILPIALLTPRHG